MNRRGVSVGCGIVIGAIALACGRPPGLSALPQREGDRFMNCLSENYSLYCPQSSRACVDRHAADYASQANEHARQLWLHTHGCSTVNSGYREPSGGEGAVATRAVPPPGQGEGAGQSRPTELTRVYDEFTRMTRVQLRAHVSEVAFSMLASIGPTGASAAGFNIFRAGSAWRYLECHHVDMLADANPVPLDSERIRTHVGAGYVSETVSVPLSPQAESMLLTASRIRFRVCNDVFELTPEQVPRVHEFLSMVAAGPLGPDAGTAPVAAASPASASTDAGHARYPWE